VAAAGQRYLDEYHSDRAGDYELRYSTRTEWRSLSFHPSLESAQAAAALIAGDPVRMAELDDGRPQVRRFGPRGEAGVVPRSGDRGGAGTSPVSPAPRIEDVDPLERTDNHGGEALALGGELPDGAGVPATRTVPDPAPPISPSASTEASDARRTPAATGLVRFRPQSQLDLAPSGAVTRVRANVEALATLRRIEREDRPAAAEEQAVMARWSGWGAVPETFDDSRDDFAWARLELTTLLSDEELAAAARNTLNAHYTDAALVEAIWGAAMRLGFEGGQVLEPGCGSGNFIGFAPQGAQLVGVELEPVTAAIARSLYPDAQVLTESFADTRAPEDSFDLVIGNVPFARAKLHDRRHNPGDKHSIHNHFILKALHLTRPGGLVMVLTSRYTMDAQNPGARREMADLADLVGAVRLPSSAHRRAAGTAAVTDLLILRRREADREPAGAAWETAVPVHVGDDQALMSEYFHQHPERVLGEVSIGHGMWGPGELLVTGTNAPAAAFAEALAGLVDEALGAGLGMAARAGQPDARPVALVGEQAKRPEGYIEALRSGAFTVVDRGASVPYRPPSTQAAELRLLLGIRDTAVALLEAEASTIDDTAEIDGLRRQLNQRYDVYAARFGPVNRFSWRRTGRRDPATGEERLARIRPEQGGFKNDPFAMVVFALEQFDVVDQRAVKADIFRERVVAPRAPRLGADSPEEALAICIDSYGRVELAEIARLLGTPDAVAAREALGRLVFDEPATGRLVPAAEYLSGNVRRKLEAAAPATAADPTLEVNATALREALPADLKPSEITARMGAAWIDGRYIQEFLREVLEDPRIDVEHPGGSTWTVRTDDRLSVLSTSRWGTVRYPAASIAQALLTQRQIRVYDEYEDANGNKKRVLNMTDTVAAQGKAAEMQARFGDWVWEERTRSDDLARVYNERFNSIVLRSYDDVELSLPGLALSFKPHPHQVAAVARQIAEPAAGLYHEVGAGKTAEMVMAAMEMRRLGLVRKPAFVVPNHMLEQFAREFLQLYPRARILAAGQEDLERDRRRLFVARCATGNWDAVIMTESAFQRVPMSAERQRDYLQAEIATIEEQLKRSRGDRGLTVKRLEQAKLQAEERIAKLLDSVKDPGITFEQTGIDYLFRDEGHRDKNLRTVSNIPGVAIDGSQRASEMHMKLSYLRERNPARYGTRATATPIANSMAEMYTETRYMRPDLLEAAGIEDFDQWAATFGETVTAIEVAPDGGFRLKARFAKFTNVPELLRIFHTFGDVKTAEDLQLPTPLLAPRACDGQRAPETVVVPRSQELAILMGQLGERAERVRNRMVDPSEDNMLSISNDGRMAALDLRLLGWSTQEQTKIDVVADRIAAIWQEHRDDEYPALDGTPHPTRGSLQIVFSDLGTPKPVGEWSVYEELRTQLVARGLPHSAVRFVHEARNDREKGELFAACRSGQVAVLVGSTERMGIGTNVQRRAVALHHMDCPWRPADIRQREGRILRQGNLNEQVRILRYVTEESFDAFTWGVVERKAKFIGQVMRGQLDAREIEDIGDSALTYQEVKALATGNPLLLDQAQAQADLARLERLERAHDHGQLELRDSIRTNRRRIERLGDLLAATGTAIARRRDTRGDAFAMTVRGHALSKRADAEARLRTTITHLIADLGTPDLQPVEIGGLGNFTITATLRRAMRAEPEVTLELVDVPESDIRLEGAQIADAALVTRLENKLTGLDRLRGETVQQMKRAGVEVARAEGMLGQPFPKADELAAARMRLGAIEAQLADVTEEQERRRGERPPTDGADQSDAEAADESVAATRREQRLEWARESSESASPAAPDPAGGMAGGRSL
jgi:N12 class adenine-specific DNA methylase/SAM-dependent methyltransferase